MAISVSYREKAAEKLKVLAAFEANLRLSEENLDHAYYLLTVIFRQIVYKVYIECG